MAIRGISLAIVGGGAGGVATFVAAVRRRAAATIYVIDPRSIGPGIAFSTSDDDVLCNTSVEAMSVIAGKSSDFLDYLSANGFTATFDSYVPRSWVGRYLADRFHRYRDIAVQNGMEVIHLPYQFRSLKLDGYRRYAIRFTDPSVPLLSVTDVAFCTGHGSSRVPDALKPYIGHPTFVGCPYPEAEMLARVPDRSRVLVLGSKLSAIDAAILLCREGHHVTMVSPSGNVPAVRGRFIRDDFPFNIKGLYSNLARWDPDDAALSPSALKRAFLRLVARTLSAYSDKPWRTQFSYAIRPEERLREEVAIVERGDSVWQDLVLNFLEVINEFYVNNKHHRLHPGLKDAFYRHATAIALPNARKLLDLMDNGKLTIGRGELSDVSVPVGDPRSWLVNLGQGRQRFDAVVAAAGFYLPCFFLNESGELEIDVDGRRPKMSVEISDRMNMVHPEGVEEQSIWFVGPPAHVRVPVPNSMFTVTPMADRAIAGMVDLSRAQQMNHEPAFPLVGSFDGMNCRSGLFGNFSIFGPSAFALADMEQFDGVASSTVEAV